jgi:hypothetical protein
MVIWLEVDPHVAVERIGQRIENEKNITGPTPMRRKWQHLHENPDDLEELASRYGEAVCTILDIYPETQILRINTTNMAAADVAEEVKVQMHQAIVDKNSPTANV